VKVHREKNTSPARLKKELAAVKKRGDIQGGQHWEGTGEDQTRPTHGKETRVRLKKKSRGHGPKGG